MVKMDENGGYDSRAAKAAFGSPQQGIGAAQAAKTRGAIGAQAAALEAGKIAPNAISAKSRAQVSKVASPSGYKYSPAAKAQMAANPAIQKAKGALMARRKPGLKVAKARLIDNDNPTNPQAQGYGGGGIQ